MPDLSINQLAGVASQPGPFALPETDVASRDTFLKLLTTQLQNQDPTSPMENEQFLSQLAQFSSLEQLMGLQTSMTAVYDSINAMNSSSMASLLGTTVVARGDTVALGETGSVDLGWNASSALRDAKLVVTDESGKGVRTIELGSIDAEGTFAWDGTDADGNRLPEGRYTFRISGTDGDGNAIIAEGRVTGVVDGMDYSDGSPQPSVNGVPMALGDILTLRTGEGDG